MIDVHSEITNAELVDFLREADNFAQFSDIPRSLYKAVKIAIDRLTANEYAKPDAYVNGDELDNMLDDRVAIIQGTRSSHRRTPLFREAAPVASNEAKPDDAICEHEWEPITEPHKCCEKCGDVRRDWDASKEAATLSEVQDAERYRKLKQRLKSHSALNGVQFETWFDTEDHDLDAAIDAQRDASKAEPAS
jgi:hypothetical protein